MFKLPIKASKMVVHPIKHKIYLIAEDKIEGQDDLVVIDLVHDSEIHEEFLDFKD